MLKKSIYSIGTLLILTMGVLSCAEGTAEIEQGQGISVTLNCAELTLTKVARPGEDAFHENTISSALCFLYPAGATTSSAVYSKRVTGLSGSGTVSFEIAPSFKVYKELFPGSATTCELFVIANYDGTIPSDTSVGALKALECGMDQDPDGFVMTGSGTVTMTQGSVMTGNVSVDLKRAASKVTIQVNVQNITDDGGTVWTPDRANICANLLHLRYNGYVGGMESSLGRLSYDNYHTCTDIGSVTEGGKTLALALFDPFYTSPFSWTSNTPTRPYFELYIAFMNGTKIINCLYSVQLPFTSFEPNQWYNLRVNITRLNTLDGASAEVVPEFTVAPWGSTEAYDTDINAQQRFFALMPTGHSRVTEGSDVYDILDNESTITVPFVSSHPVSVKAVELSTTDFAPDTPAPKALSSSGVSYSVYRDKVVISHALNNDLSNPDAAPYYIKVTLGHKDRTDGTWQDVVKIKQIPAICITAEFNGAYKDDGTHDTDTYKGKVMVNDGLHTDDDTKNDKFLGKNGSTLDGATNKNDNMYVVTVKSTTYAFSNNIYSSKVTVVGDPRVSTIDNLYRYGFHWSKSTKAMTGSDRYLSYYHPTGTDPKFDNLIAPSFRVASSHGVTSAVTYEDAARRCASYQEKGYPAGRWRLPTMAEVEFIMNLSRAQDQKIPFLFGRSDEAIYYWISGYRVLVPVFSDHTTHLKYEKNFDKNVTNSVRCVYDDWYWTDKCDENTFTWGDR